MSVVTPTGAPPKLAYEDLIAGLYSSGHYFATSDDFIADTGLGYAAGLNSVAAGDSIATGGRVYVVAASDAVDAHLTSAGGVKVYEAGLSYTTRARAIRSIAAGDVGAVAGDTIRAAGLEWVYVSAVYTAGPADMPGWKPLGVPQPEHFADDPDGPDFQRLLDWMDDEGVYTTEAYGSYTLTSGMVVPDPNKLRIMWGDASFTTAAEILMIDCNGRADVLYADNESRQNFVLEVGSMSCTIGGTPSTATKAMAVRYFGFRGAELDLPDVRGFAVGVDLNGKDTVKWKRFKGFNNACDIRIPPWTDKGGPLNMMFENIHLSHAKHATTAFAAYNSLTDTVFRDIQLNLGDDHPHTPAIDIWRGMHFGVSSKTGTFTQGETLTGSTSGATCTFDFVFTHEHPFQIAQHLDWVVCYDRSATEFVQGETLTGSSSGATAVIGDHPNYLVQTGELRGVTFEGFGHTEVGSVGAPSASIGLRVWDRIGQGTRARAFSLNLGTNGMNGNGSIGAQFKGVVNTRIRGDFSQTAKPAGTPAAITAMTNSPNASTDGVFTSAAHGLATGDWVVLDGFIGDAICLSGNYYKVGTVTTDTFTLVDLEGLGVNTRYVGTYGGTGGTFDKVTMNSPLQFDEDCRQVVIDSGTEFSTGVIDLNGMPRSELTFVGVGGPLDEYVPLKNWKPKSLTANENNKFVDMSDQFPDFAKIGGLGPKGYTFQIKMEDDDSAAVFDFTGETVTYPSTSAARMRLRKPSETNASRYCDITVNGMPNGVAQTFSPFVLADVNGDFMQTTSPSGTLDVEWGVVAVHY